MEIIWLLLIIVLTLIGMSENFGHYSLERLYDGSIRKTKKGNKFFFIIASFLLIIVSGLRSGIGDTGYYMYSFSNLSSDFGILFSDSEFGFNIYQYVLKIFLRHPQSLLFISSTITISLIMITIYKYSTSLFLSVFLFIASGYYVSTMNGLRQHLVAAILFFCVTLIIENRKILYFIIVILLSSVHNSAIILIPLYYFIKQRAWGRVTNIVLIFSIILFFGFQFSTNTLFSILDSTYYRSYISTFGTSAFAGASIVRVIVVAIPMVLSYIYKDRLREKVPNSNIYMNFSIINFIVYLFALNNWIFARLGIYFIIFDFLLLPAIITSCFKNNRLIISYMMVTLYCLFLHFEMKPYIYTSFYLQINTHLIGGIARFFYY